MTSFLEKTGIICAVKPGIFLNVILVNFNINN